MMKRLLTLIALIILSFPAHAGQVRYVSDYADVIRKAEHYLDNLGTAQARFLQTSPNGNQLIGTFYLNRPGRLRFEYDDPIEDFVVADGYLIYFYDAELGEQTNAPIGMTLADFLLRPELRLSGEISVSDVKSNGGITQISLVQTGEPEAGSITLGFTDEPFALKKWRVTDPTGAITEIELFQLKTNLALAENLFIYSDPKRFETRYND